LPRKARAMSAIVSRSPLITPVAFTWLGRSSWLTARKQGLQVTRCRWAALSRSALQFGIGWVLGFCSAARSSTRARRRRGPPHSHRRRTSSALQQSQWYGARRDMWDPSATALILETGQRSDSMRRGCTPRRDEATPYSVVGRVRSAAISTAGSRLAARAPQIHALLSVCQ
jgi:hypothetical protein